MIRFLALPATGLRWCRATLAFIGFVFVLSGAAGQQSSQLPFGVGEKATYSVSYGVFGRVGSGTLEVLSLDTIRGRPTYHLRMAMRARVLFARVDDVYESWLDVDSLSSLRFFQNLHQIKFRRIRTLDFFPSEMRWTGQINGRAESGALETTLPLDELSFVFLARTLDLQVGREFEFPRYWNPSGNPVRMQVLRSQSTTVPAGTFQTAVVRPIIRTSGLFNEGGDAEVHFNEDGRRQVVKLRLKLSFGTVQLQLEQFIPGHTFAR